MIVERLLPLLRRATAGLACALALGAAGFAHAAATINIVVANGPGEGFNDPTPAAPVGGNTGTTLGEQRLNAFKHAAAIWAGKLSSTVPINILSSFEALPCSTTSAVLGAAGAMTIWRDFPNAPKTGTWYPAALANKLANEDLQPPPTPDGSDAEIIAFFNANLGNPDCLAGSGFYLGLDGNHGNQIDLVAVLLHEFGHGLGFQSFTDESTGQMIEGYPAIWDHFLVDTDSGKTWVKMTDAERAASAVKPRKLVWNGRNVVRDASLVLKRGTPELFVGGSRDVAGFYLIGTAAFGPALTAQPVVAQIGGVVDQPDGTTGLACTPLDITNTRAVQGRIALIDRGGCPFTVKVKNAQDAGAKAVIVADNVAGSPPPDLGGTDPSITIPAVRISQDDGARLRARLAALRNPFALLYLNQFKLAGADWFQRPYLYSPTPLAPGSSVSHYDTLATPNLLMEPFINDDQPHEVTAPRDLTLELLKDTGW